MDFLRSYFIRNEPLISWRFLWPFISLKLDSPLIKTLERHSLDVKCVSPMFWLLENLILMKEMFKWSEVHSYRNNFLKDPFFSRVAGTYLNMLRTCLSQIAPLATSIPLYPLHWINSMNTINCLSDPATNSEFFTKISIYA